MTYHFYFSDGRVLRGSITPEEDNAITLFCSVQDKTADQYIQEVISAAVQTAVNMISFAGGAEKVKSVLDRQGGAK